MANPFKNQAFQMLTNGFGEPLNLADQVNNVAAALCRLAEERDDYNTRVKVELCQTVEVEAELGRVQALPDVASRMGVGDGSVADAVTALIGALACAERDLADLKARRCEGCKHFEGSHRVTSYEVGGSEEPTEFTQRARCHKHQRPVNDPCTDFCSEWEAKR